MARSPKQCEWCGQDFTRKVWGQDWRKARFCSMRCAGLMRRKDPLHKILIQTRRDSKSGCLIWTGKTHGGYGLTNLYKRRSVHAHIAMWELKHGHVSPGFELHHTCGNKLCCEPEHLQPVTDLEHSKLHALTHCPNGHLYDSENTYIYPDGQRECRICRRARIRRYEHKRSAKIHR